jgi:Galactose oxidase, central domain/Kelch motif
MTDQRELDRVLDAFLLEGTDEVADRVIDAALDQIDHTRQRRALRMPRRFSTMTMPIRLAAAAVIGVLAVGGALYLTRPGQPAVGGSGPAPSASASASQSAATPSPTPTPTPAASTAMPSPMALTGPLGVGRQIQTSTLLADGRVVIAGGFDFADLPLASASLCDPATNTCSPTGSMAAARGLHTATLLSDGRVLIAGGGPASWIHPGPYLASAELFDPKTGTFSPTGSMTTTREAQTATRLNDGRVLIVGGSDVGEHAVASAELYDPQTGTFSPTGSMTTARAFHTATLLSDGRVLITGGRAGTWTSGPILASAEIYNPKTGTFSATGPMTDGRTWHVATVLSDGRVLITGGVNGGVELASAELYDPTAGTFTRTGSMRDVRLYQTATLLADGRVLVAGGGGDYTNRIFLASAELFDPKTGTFTVTGSMSSARTYQTASLLADGRVLVAGGYGALGPLASAELYDPKTGTFGPAGLGG